MVPRRGPWRPCRPQAGRHGPRTRKAPARPSTLRGVSLWGFWWMFGSEADGQRGTSITPVFLRALSVLAVCARRFPDAQGWLAVGLARLSGSEQRKGPTEGVRVSHRRPAMAVRCTAPLGTRRARGAGRSRNWSGRAPSRRPPRAAGGAQLLPSPVFPHQSPAVGAKPRSDEGAARP